MRKAENTFISSTFWGERTGFVAALASLNEFKMRNVFNKILKNGKEIKKIWEHSSIKHKVPIKIMGTDGIPSFEFIKDHNINKTYLTKRMLENKILATNVIYINIFHNNNNLQKYKKAFDKVFYEISKKI